MTSFLEVHPLLRKFLDRPLLIVNKLLPREKIWRGRGESEGKSSNLHVFTRVGRTRSCKSRLDFWYVLSALGMETKLNYACKKGTKQQFLYATQFYNHVLAYGCRACNLNWPIGSQQAGKTLLSLHPWRWHEMFTTRHLQFPNPYQIVCNV